MSYRKINEQRQPSSGVNLNMEIDIYDGKALDTSCELSGGFCISGLDREEFTQKLGNLIDEYRI